MNMTGIIFSNIYDKTLGTLTSVRAASSVPFGGRYRMIDFILSNMVNSDIVRIGVIAKYNYSSLMDHLHYPNDWDLERKHGGLFIIPPFGHGKAPVYRGKLDALSGAMDFLSWSREEYVVIADSTVVCNIDFSEVLKKHIESKATITCVASREYASGKMDLVFENDNDGKVSDILTDFYPKDGNLCGMGMYIMKRLDLMDIVSQAVSRGYTNFERDFLQRCFYRGTISVNVYEFKNTVLRNSDVAAYFANNMALLKEGIRKSIFLEERPVFTKVRNESPTLYCGGCSVDNSLIADGCVIKGAVENSIVFRNVTIEEGAIVKNCIVMQGTVIEKNAMLNYAIFDKDVVVTKDTCLQGAANVPVIIDKGMTV